MTRRAPLVSLVGLAVLTSLACANIVVDSPEFRERYAPPRDYAWDRARCLDALKASLEEEEYTLAEFDPDAGVVKTDKRTFTIEAVRSGTNRTTGYKGTPQYESYTERYELEQSAQLAFRVTGTDDSCRITLTAMRLWNRAERVDRVQGAGARWVRDQIVDPIYTNLDDAF